MIFSGVPSLIATLSVSTLMRIFTVEEANLLLPELRRRLAELDRVRQLIRRFEPQAKLAADRAEQGGGAACGIEYAATLVKLLAATQDILNLGVEIKDVDRGLCDFPHLREGKIVYLCWQKGEDRVEWWHDIEAGFAGRQPL